jgi:hypothetical protein
MHPLVEKIIRQLSENEYLVKMKNGEVAVWRSKEALDEEEKEVQDLDYVLALSG